MNKDLISKKRASYFFPRMLLFGEIKYSLQSFVLLLIKINNMRTDGDLHRK